MTSPDLLLLFALACSSQGAARSADEHAMCAAQAPREVTSGQEAQIALERGAEDRTGSDLMRSVTFGVGVNRNYPSGEFAQFSVWKPYKQGITVDVGERHNDDDSSVGIGLRSWRQLDAKTVVSVDGSTGTEPFAVKYGIGGAINRSVAGVGVTVGAGYRKWWDDTYSTEVGLGLQKWFPHVIVGGDATYSEGEPASFTGWRGNVGLTYYWICAFRREVAM